MITINAEVPRNKLTDTRKVFLHGKGRCDDILCELGDEFSTFEHLAEIAVIEDMWSLFKNKILLLTEKYVLGINPSKF